MAVFKDIFTSKDGESFNFAKIIGIFILLAFLGASWYAYVLKGVIFDPAIWGGVLTTIYGTVNGAIRMTHVTEPE